MKKILTTVIAITIMLALSSQATFATDDTTGEAYKAVEQTVYQSFKKHPEYGSEWLAMGLARSGKYKTSSSIFETYYENLAVYIRQKKGVLNERKYTEYSKAIIALTAIDRKAFAAGGYNLNKRVIDTKKVSVQGINGEIWALIALNCQNEKNLLQGGKEAKDVYVNSILSKEIQGGGWALSGEKADADVTAMAVQALAPYYSINSEVGESVDRAVKVLSDMQNEDGTYSSWGTKNSESCSQVIVAVSSLGIDPAKDDRFIKQGKSLIDGLMKFYSKGQFKHALNGSASKIATEQGYYAFVSYFRLVNGKTALYDMSDGGKFVITSSVAPKRTSISYIKSTKKRTIKVSWKSVYKARGYQVYCSSKKSFSPRKVISTTSRVKSFGNLKSGKRYYFKVRAYKYVDGRKKYGNWSYIKSVKAK